MRQILAAGFEIGDHTLTHPQNPGYHEIAGDRRVIAKITGFTPCLFRPPYGSFSGSEIGDARRAHLKTILWNVDPRDWSRPGSGAIAGTVVNTTHPGSIVIMHDGGGDRSETVAALPRIIHTLRSRGYRFDTVTQLLGDRFIYGLGG
jgi:peptidoglycan/xylan/chitin deacetylase (PgdA/CDA1 family)